MCKLCGVEVGKDRITIQLRSTLFAALDFVGSGVVRTGGIFFEGAPEAEAEGSPARATKGKGEDGRGGSGDKDDTGWKWRVRGRELGRRKWQGLSSSDEGFPGISHFSFALTQVQGEPIIRLYFFIPIPISQSCHTICT